MFEIIIPTENVADLQVGPSENNKEKPSIGKENSAIESENSAFGTENPAIQKQKLAIDTFKQSINRMKYIKKTREKLIEIYNNIENDQIFGTPEIMEILDCSRSTSKEIMKKMRDIQAVVPVSGKGKGKYRFAHEEEVKK